MSGYAAPDENTGNYWLVISNERIEVLFEIEPTTARVTSFSVGTVGASNGADKTSNTGSESNTGSISAVGQTTATTATESVANPSATQCIGTQTSVSTPVPSGTPVAKLSKPKVVTLSSAHSSEPTDIDPEPNDQEEAVKEQSPEHEESKTAQYMKILADEGYFQAKRFKLVHMQGYGEDSPEVQRTYELEKGRQFRQKYKTKEEYDKERRKRKAYAKHKGYYKRYIWECPKEKHHCLMDVDDRYFPVSDTFEGEGYESPEIDPYAMSSSDEETTAVSSVSALENSESWKSDSEDDGFPDQEARERYCYEVQKADCEEFYRKQIGIPGWGPSYNSYNYFKFLDTHKK